LTDAPDASTPPPHDEFSRPDVLSVIQGIREREGREFERAVSEAMEYLDLDSVLPENTEGESDVIAEALHAEVPYFIVIECQAVRPGNQVGYDKLGQIRGNASSYLDARRQQFFTEYYRIVVGKPEFSHTAKERAAPDVGLMPVDSLVKLVELHKDYCLSQNLLKRIFGHIGIIETSFVESTVKSYLRNEIGYFRKLKLYSLIYLALLENPVSDKFNRRKKWTPVIQAMGQVLTFGQLFGMQDVNASEIGSAIRDLGNPFLRVVESRDSEIRLSTTSLRTIGCFNFLGRDIATETLSNINKLRGLRIEH